MRNPAKKRTIATICTLAGLASVGVLALGLVPPKGAAAITIIIVGLNTAFFGLCYTIFCHVEVLRHKRLLSGRGVIARWTISPQDWQAFIALNDQINASTPDYRFNLDKAHRARTQPTEVIIGEASLMMHDDFHSLPRAGFTQISGPYSVEGPPYCLEWQFYNAGGETTTSSTWALRVPVAPGREADVAAVLKAYQSRQPAFREVSKPGGRLRRNIALAVAILSALAFGAAMLMRNEFTTDAGKTTIMITLIVSILLAPAALLVAVVWHVRGKRS